MLNKEKFAKKIVEIACVENDKVAVVDGKPIACSDIHGCKACLFDHPIYHDCKPERREEWANSEYVEPPVDWSKVAVDTPILVRDYDYQDWFKRHFAKFENGVVFSWAEGSTSWSAERSVRWKQAKLAESEE